MRCSDTAVIHFDDVRVPADHIIGEEGMGFTYQMLQVHFQIGIWGNIFYVTLLKTYLVAVRSFLFVLQRIKNISFYQFQIERLAAAALNIVPLETCIQDTIEYTKTRTVFGKPLINNQVSLYLFMFCVHLWISKLLYKT